MNDDIPKGILTGGSCSQNGNKELRHGHADGSQEQDWASSPLVNSVKTGNSRTNIDTAGNQTDNKLILEARVLEELRAVVEDKVDASQLLESLEQASGEKTLSKATLETLDITGASNAHFVFMVSPDLGNFFKQSGIISRETSKFGQTPDGSFVVVCLNEITGCFGKDKHADHKDNGPCELDRDGDAVGAGIIAGVGGVVHDGGQQ